MTPAARLSAAIAILDAVLAGEPAERALTNWARASRFAGSGDRQAVRDHVFDALRCRRSFAALGGAESGRGLMIGALRAAGVDPEGLFTGEGHAPPPLAEAERAPPRPMAEAEALDCPDWLAPRLRASLGDDFAPVMALMRQRAPVFLRANAARTSREAAIAALAAEGIASRPGPLAATAIEVTGQPRRIAGSAAYREGLVELQDAASQAVVEALPLAPGERVLDYCAGGGGKSLALAAGGARVTAHDAAPTRMRDLPERARRAGVRIDLAEGVPRGRFPLVLLDVPCSGSGSWRRAPEGKWRLDPARLAALEAVQAEILAKAAPLVAPGGHLAYATCSLLDGENGVQVEKFLSSTGGWRLKFQRRFTPLEGGDGFYLAVMEQA